MMQKIGLRAGLTGALVLAAAGMAGAHLFADGFKPAAGETLHVGDTYSITWSEQFNHAKGTNVDLSVNGGTSWTTIKENFADAQGSNTFKWTVAGTATTTAKIRICQHDGGTVKACTDADKTNSLSSAPNGNYVLVGPAFTIATGTSGINAAAPAAGAFSIDYNPATRNVDVSFGILEGQPVLLQAFDTQGRLLATLVEGNFAAGEHNLSLFSNRIDASVNALIFKLKVGNRTQSHAWSMAR
jgi:hypothetical protein